MYYKDFNKLQLILELGSPTLESYFAIELDSMETNNYLFQEDFYMVFSFQQDAIVKYKIG